MNVPIEVKRLLKRVEELEAKVFGKKTTAKKKPAKKAAKKKTRTRRKKG